MRRWSLRPLRHVSFIEGFGPGKGWLAGGNHSFVNCFNRRGHVHRNGLSGANWPTCVIPLHTCRGLFHTCKGLFKPSDSLPFPLNLPPPSLSFPDTLVGVLPRQLLRRGANPNVSASPYPVLLTAIESRDTSMVELLLEHGASANCEMVTSTGRDTALLRATGLLSKDLAASRPGRTKLRWQSGTANPAARPTVKSVADAARLKMSKAAAIIELLLKYGADANLPGSGGRLPLHTAAAVDSSHAAHVVQALLGRGARTDVAWQGETPLSLAVRSGNDDVVSSLLDAGTGTGSMLLMSLSRLFGPCKPAILHRPSSDASLGSHPLLTSRARPEPARRASPGAVDPPGGCGQGAVGRALLRRSLRAAAAAVAAGCRPNPAVGARALSWLGSILAGSRFGGSSKPFIARLPCGLRLAGLR